MLMDKELLVIQVLIFLSSLSSCERSRVNTKTQTEYREKTLTKRSYAGSKKNIEILNIFQCKFVCRR